MDNEHSEVRERREAGTDPEFECSADRAWRMLVADELGASRRMLIHIQERLDDLREMVEKRFDQHEAYHERNEMRWGPTKWFDGQPGRLVFVAAILLIATAANVTIEQVMAVLQALPVEP